VSALNLGWYRADTGTPACRNTVPHDLLAELATLKRLPKGRHCGVQARCLIELEEIDVAFRFR